MNKKLSATPGNSKQYTLAVAAAMTDNGYSFKPAEEVFCFGELLHHIACCIEWWGANYVKGIKTEWAPPAAKPSKKKWRLICKKAYDAPGNTISSSSLSDEAMSGFYATPDHSTHHRGQAVTYLRCKGITTPEYMY